MYLHVWWINWNTLNCRTVESNKTVILLEKKYRPIIIITQSFEFLFIWINKKKILWRQQIRHWFIYTVKGSSFFSWASLIKRQEIFSIVHIWWIGHVRTRFFENSFLSSCLREFCKHPYCLFSENNIFIVQIIIKLSLMSVVDPGLLVKAYVMHWVP